MKKISILFMTSALMLALVGCVGSSDNTESNDGTEQTDSTEVSVSDTSINNTPVEESENKKALEGIAYVAGRSIAVNYDEARRVDTKSTSIVFHSNTASIIALTYDKTVSFDGSVADVFELLNDGDVFKDISVYSEGDFKGSENIYLIDVASTESVDIAGLDMVRYTGTVKDGSKIEFTVYSYTFIVDSTPCMLTGIFSAEVDIQQAFEEIDSMAKTVRME